jgi:hypothetical protein
MRQVSRSCDCDGLSLHARGPCAGPHLRPFKRCVSAEPAAVFEDLLALSLLSTLDAAVAAIDEVVLDGASRCDSAEPAADLAALLELLLCKILDAAVAASLEVVSDFVAIFRYLLYFLSVK